jgi:hypothetical protein
MGRVSALPGLAAPGDDRGALESDVREAVQRRAVRPAASAEARLGRQKGDKGTASPTEYLPRRLGPLPALADGDEIQELIRKVQNSEAVPQAQERLISPGATMGGARPKALVNIAGDQWVIKFADGDPADTPLIEHAAMTLARKASIRVARAFTGL